MLALKALCEARLDRDDLRGKVEDAIRPSKETRAAAKATGFLPSVDDFRRQPLGVDSSGLEYHYFELRLCSEGALTHSAPTCDLSFLDSMRYSAVPSPDTLLRVHPLLRASKRQVSTACFQEA